MRGDDELGRLAASFNRDDGGAGALRGGAAPAGRRRLARAAHAAGHAAHQHRDARPRRRAGAGRARPPGRGPDRGARGDDRPRRRRGRAGARAGREPAAPEDVRLDELAHDAVERARRRARGLEFRETLEPSLVGGDPDRLDRAICNLLDNAAKWSPDGGVVEVEVAGGRVRVRDHGPGFAPTTCRRCSTASGARTKPAACPGRAWAWRSSAGSPSGTAAPPAPRTRRAAGPRWRSSCLKSLLR